jgi:hypothetical protein
LEVASGEHGEHGLAEAVDRQLPLKYDKPVEAVTSPEEQVPVATDSIPQVVISKEVPEGRRCSPFKQFLLLYLRNLQILRRDFVSKIMF